MTAVVSGSSRTFFAPSRSAQRCFTTLSRLLFSLGPR